jgi:inner membrane protein
MNPAQPPVIPTPARRRLSVFIKIGGICLLIALLHVPLVLTKGVLNERQSYQWQATEEISSVWGREQIITGPVLAVPYAYRTQVMRARVVNGKVIQVEETELSLATAYFLPESLVITGPVEPEIRRRGIYEAVVYSTRLKFAGNFNPDFAVAGIEAERIDWQKAHVHFGVSDLRGVRSVGPIQINGMKSQTFESVEVGCGLFSLEAKVPELVASGPIEFGLDALLQGSENLEIAPIGRTTKVSLSSSWCDPSFIGDYLPVARTVDSDGFKADWETAHFSRGFPQSWTSRQTSHEDMRGKMAASSFGVRFAQSVNGYGMVERAQKYGVLFFVLVFAVFFLFEVTSKLRIHPLQYALVGAALCLFFLGFLALSEFLATGRAYAIAGVACTALVSLYAWSFLKTGMRTLIIAGGLGATYGYLYFVLQSQDYALVAGTVALFAALALVMFCTRKINWYAIDTGKEA